MRVYSFLRLGLDGRTGNQMFQVAATVNASVKDKGSRAAIPADWEYRPLFDMPPRYYKAPKQGDEIIDLSADRDYGPYYQRLQDIQKAPVRRFFTPSPLGGELLEAKHSRLLNETYPLCAIHVRRADYVQHSDRFPLLTPHYYEQACKMVLDEFPSVRFLVFSDDIAWCKANPDLIGVLPWPHEFIEGDVAPIPMNERSKEPRDILDLWMMSRCSSIIVANSTFSWWAAYLSDAKVYYPDVWFGPDVEPFTGFPEHWTMVNC